MAIFPPATSGTSGSNYNPRNTQCMAACPAVFKRGGYNFRLPPLKVRDLRLDLEKNISFSDSLLVKHSGGRPTFYRLPSHLKINRRNDDLFRRLQLFVNRL